MQRFDAACVVPSTEYRVLRAGRISFATGCFALLVSILAAQPVWGQDAKPSRLMDQAPFDVLTLDKANGSKALKVYPVNLPGRRIPEKPKGSDKLRIKLVEDGLEYDIAWNNIAKLELFEQMVLAEANQLTTDGKFDEAYDELAFLIDFYPRTPGLAEARQSFLYQSAGVAFRQGKYEEALAALEELLAQNPTYRAGGNSPTLLTVLGNIADPLIARCVEKQDYRATRFLLARLARQYKADNEPFVQRWRQQLAELAARRRDEAQAHLQAGRLGEARDACLAMQEIWPELTGAAELIAEIARRHPRVIVGVEHPALAFDTLSLHDVAARRAGRLRERLLVELAGPGAEGGRYESPLGTLSHDGLKLTFGLRNSAGGAAALDLSQRLLARAEPASRDYQRAWGRIVSAVRVRDTSDVEVDLRPRHVLPEALLQVPLDASAAGGSVPPTAPFALFSRDETTSRFISNPEYAFHKPTQPAEIVERLFDDPQRALLALQRGEIDVLDRVFPGDIVALKSAANVVVAPYRLPTTHVLIIRSANPYLANSTFRRALLYGSNRELLLTQGLLRGHALPGFRVVSSPFPAPSPGISLPAYGYDQQIEPRPYDPRLALTLRVLAEGELKAAYEKQHQEPPKLAPLVLGHPADETSRIACRGLVKQWQQIGIECKLTEFPPGVFDDTEKTCDVVYMQLAAWEPIVDADRLLGEGGLAPPGSKPIQLALRQIEAARNWQEARQQLLHLHRLLHEDVTILPLWQTMDHFAYRRTLPGITPQRVRLYQDVEQWQTAAKLAGSLP